MDLLQFMQDLHSKEFTTKESLAQRASTIIAGITTLAGALAFVAVNARWSGHLADAVFWLLTIASAAVLMTAAFYLIWSYRVPALKDIARPKEWLSYWQDLQKQAAEGQLASAETEFNDYLLNQYAEIGDGNIQANFDRGTRLVNSNNALLVAFVLVVLAALMFYVSNYIIPASARTAPGGEVTTMITQKGALVCVPAEKIPGADQKGPKPRPVPNPGPQPGP